MTSRTANNLAVSALYHNLSEKFGAITKLSTSDKIFIGWLIICAATALYGITIQSYGLAIKSGILWMCGLIIAIVIEEGRYTG